VCFESLTTIADRLQCVAVCCSMLQCIAVRYSVAVRCIMLECVSGARRG